MTWISPLSLTPEAMPAGLRVSFRKTSLACMATYALNEALIAQNTIDALRPEVFHRPDGDLFYWYDRSAILAHNNTFLPLVFTLPERMGHHSWNPTTCRWGQQGLEALDLNTAIPFWRDHAHTLPAPYVISDADPLPSGCLYPWQTIPLHEKAYQAASAACKAYSLLRDPADYAMPIASQALSWKGLHSDNSTHVLLQTLWTLFCPPAYQYFQYFTHANAQRIHQRNQNLLPRSLFRLSITAHERLALLAMLKEHLPTALHEF